MDYAKILRILRFAEAEGAATVTLDLDEGEVTVPLADALQGWADLSPGMPYDVVAIGWADE